MKRTWQAYVLGLFFVLFLVTESRAMDQDRNEDKVGRKRVYTPLPLAPTAKRQYISHSPATIALANIEMIGNRLISVGYDTANTLSLSLYIPTMQRMDKILEFKNALASYSRQDFIELKCIPFSNQSAKEPTITFFFIQFRHYIVQEKKQITKMFLAQINLGNRTGKLSQLGLSIRNEKTSGIRYLPENTRFDFYPYLKDLPEITSASFWLNNQAINFNLSDETHFLLQVNCENQDNSIIYVEKP